MRGQAEANQGRWSPAARAYLDAFTARPDGQRAPAALTALGGALGQLGQVEEACVTLAEVAVRYPGTPQVAEAEAERGRLGCQ
jgi:TolA-binding protein